MISLDRFRWVPRGIGPDCPRCVLDEWAETLGVSPQLYSTVQLVPLIHERNRLLAATVLTAGGPTTPEQWSRFAQFINPRCKWTPTALAQAWRRLGLSLQDGPGNAPDGEVGWLSPRSLRRVPVTLAYGCLVARDVYVPPNATPSQLTELLYLSRRTVGEAGLRKAVLTLLHTQPGMALSAWAFLKHHAHPLLQEVYQPGRDQAGRLRSLFQQWEPKLLRIEQYEPRTHDEAVLFAAMQYGVDLHLSSNPLNEYTHLVLSIAEHAGRSRGQIWGCIQYVHPVDSSLQQWTARTPAALSLAQAYRPVFPVELWPHDAAKDLAERWGKNATYASHEMGIHEFLQWRAVSLHFVGGHPKDSLNLTSPISLTDVAAIPPADALAFGTDELGYSTMPWTELQQWFENSQQMTWPALPPGQPIDACALAQLERLAQDRQWFTLVQAIRILREEQTEERQAAKAFVARYRQALPAEKQAVETALWTWLYLGMAMRGWTAEPPSAVDGLHKAALYNVTPFVLHDTAVEPGDTLDVRIHRWASLLHDAIDACGVFWRVALLGCRMVLFRDGQYTSAHDREQGVTLEDRLNLLTRTENVYSCVRLSSNWMCSSSYYYMTELGMPLPFSLHDLVCIS